MTREWEPCVQYNYGDVVVFDDVEYKIVQPHRSQGDWTPPYTPALWERMQGDHHHHQHGEQRGGDHHRQHDEQRGGDRKSPAEPPSYYGQQQHQTEEEKEKHWYDLDDKRKKELEIGGGLVAGVAAIGAGYYAYNKHQHQEDGRPAPAVEATEEEKPWYEEHKKELAIGGGLVAGAAAIGAGYYAHEQKQQRQEVDQPAPAVEATEEKPWYEEHKKELEIGGGLVAGVAAIGAGYYAYKSHERKKEEESAQAWSEGNWIRESQARTQQWRAGQYNAPIAWIWNKGKSIPRDAIQGGEENGESLYICRAYHEGGILIGKASKVFKEGAVIGYKKDEIHLSEYEILVGDSRAVRWVPCSGQLNLNALRAKPVEGGREPGGDAIYVAQAPYHGAVHPGKASEVYGDGCFIPYDDTEKKVKEYAVLCLA